MVYNEKNAMITHMKSRPKPICIIGPTAVGKTNYAIDLAKSIDAEIISADSMQVYRYMDIGTAKPGPKELAQVKHYLIDILDPDEPYSAFDFVQHIQQLIPEIQSRNKQVLIVGGTGLYMNSLFSGLSFTNIAPDPEYREKLANLSKEELYARLKEADPESAKRIHPNNKQRMVRTLEVFKISGKPLFSQVTSSHRENEYEIIGLHLDKQELNTRINDRVDVMFDNGLIDEVQDLLTRGYHKKLQSMQALGYKETIAYLEYTKVMGSLGTETVPNSNPADTTQLAPLTLTELKDLIKLRTRQFAKRQMTWFRRFQTTRWIDV
ncbi:MAG: tRNA (adenosine(37)-N6)-dimethylallyltransferase MiaA [Candidatus Margulisiibacteriota bacterium]